MPTVSPPTAVVAKCYNYHLMRHTSMQSFDDAMDFVGRRLCDIVTSELDEVITTAMRSHASSDLFVSLRVLGPKVLRSVFKDEGGDMQAADEAWCQAKCATLCDRLITLIDDNTPVFMALNAHTWFSRTLMLVDCECCLLVEEIRTWGRLPRAAHNKYSLADATCGFGEAVPLRDPEFEDYGDYYLRTCKVRSKYEQLLALSMDDVHMQSDIVIAVSPDWLASLLREGQNCMVHLVGTANRKWCRQQNLKLYLRLTSVMRVMTQMRMFTIFATNIVDRRHQLHSRLREELYDFLGWSWDLRGVCGAAMRAGFVDMHVDLAPPDDIAFYDVLTPEQYARTYISLRQRAQLIIALLMALHARLGKASALGELPEALLQTIICQHVFMPREMRVASTNGHFSGSLDPFMYVVA